MAVVQRAVYRPRRPRESPLYRLVEDLFDTLVGVYEERFEPKLGRLRHATRRALERTVRPDGRSAAAIFECSWRRLTQGVKLRTETLRAGCLPPQPAGNL